MDFTNQERSKIKNIIRDVHENDTLTQDDVITIVVLNSSDENKIHNVRDKIDTIITDLNLDDKYCAVSNNPCKEYNIDVKTGNKKELHVKGDISIGIQSIKNYK